MFIDIDLIEESENVNVLLDTDKEYQEWLNSKLNENIEFIEENYFLLEKLNYP